MTANDSKVKAQQSVALANITLPFSGRK